MEDIHREEIPKFVFGWLIIFRRKEWRGTATQLITQMNETEVTPNVVTKMLARFFFGSFSAARHRVQNKTHRHKPTDLL